MWQDVRVRLRTRFFREPQGGDLLIQAADRGEPLGRITVALLHLLDRYGATELQAGIQEALQRGVPHPNAVRLSPN